MRTMYDSVTATDIPTTAEMVAGYVNGPYAWSDADWARFAGKPRVAIAVSADGGGDCLDVERYDATPSDAPGWIRARQDAGVKDVAIYCDLSTLPAVEDACAGLTYYRWVAHYTGTAHEEPGTAACQYASPDYGSGGHYDLSLVYDDTWHATTDWTTAIMQKLPTLKMGATGFPVDNLQSLLGGSWSRHGDSPVPVNQSFDADTERQLKLVQSRHGLVVDGICGPKTWHLLLLAD